MGVTQIILLLIWNLFLSKNANSIVHPRKIIKSILNVQLLSSVRFTLIGLSYTVTLGNIEYSPYNKKDFGFLPLNWRLEGAISYMLLIINMHWNLFWTYDLYLSVRKPMSYSEKLYSFYWKWTYLIGIILGLTSFFINSLISSDKKSTIWIMNEGFMYILFVTLPLICTIVINLFVNLKYGRDKYLKKFPKNYQHFQIIFSAQRVYFILWTISMIPSVFFSFLSRKEYMTAYTWVLALQPLWIIFTVVFSIKKKNKYENKRMREAGIVQQYMENSGENMDS